MLYEPIGFPRPPWAHDKQQRRSLLVVRQNAGEAAEEIDRIADNSEARLIVLTGDIRAVTGNCWRSVPNRW